MRFKCFIYLLVPFLLLNVLHAQPIKNEPEPVKAQILAENKSIKPGQPFWVGVELQVEDGWDTYWINPGDSGFPTEVTWHLPDGFKAGPLQWPYPERFGDGSLVGFGYKHSVLLLTEITPPKDITKNAVNLSADVTWLACKESCIPGKAEISLDLPVTNSQPQQDAQIAKKFAKAREFLPITDGATTAILRNDEVILNVKPTSALFDKIQTVDFIPQEGDLFDYSAPQQMQKENGVITVHLKPISDQRPDKVRGVLLISEKSGVVSQAIQVNAPLADSQAAGATAGLTMGIAILLAFAGGMILNVMPCVLPVIVLKIFSFVKMAHEKRSLIFKHGMLFTCGVLVSFWILSGALLVLRAYGESIGWGFQLQEPVFVAVLSALLFLMGLSLFGVFEIGTSLISLGQRSSSTSTLSSSFMSGVLATLVATPCTGPLLGTALGFAMTLPSLSALSIFTAMGLGMASPYLVCSAFPKLVRFLPKPGNWLIIFKQFMGFLMMATVVWLVWVFGAQTDNMATFVLLASFLMLAIGAWIFGKWATPARRKFTRIFATLFSALIIFTGSGAAVLIAKQHRLLGNQQIDVVSGWEAYDPEKIEKLRKEGTPVFVDFTAKWCLICQANKVPLHSSAVQAALKEKGVVTMTADWTKKDARITDELQKLGRSGVPVYVIYPGNPKSSPIILPQTLTSNIVIDYLNQIE